MTTSKRINLIALAVVLLVSVSVRAADAPPAIPETPTSVDKILYAQPFVLDKGMEFLWSQERPIISTGYLLVLEVNPDLVVPRQIAEPVLYVGKQTAQRVNFGHESGRVIAIVPAELNKRGDVDLDLSKTRIWFGTPELPERVDVEMIEQEHDMAANAGIQPQPVKEISAAIKAGGSRAASFADGHELMFYANELVGQYSPKEKKRATH